VNLKLLRPDANVFPSLVVVLPIRCNHCDHLAFDQHDCGFRRVTQGLAAFGDVEASQTFPMLVSNNSMRSKNSDIIVGILPTFIWTISSRIEYRTGLDSTSATTIYGFF
jgi:hypothetical protein